MKITILGSGTSTGVPVPGCCCAICKSTDKLNQRLRTSAYVELEGKDLPDPLSAPGGILIDTTPDLRYQLLRTGFTRLDAVLYTHAHADHINGIDDLRTFNFLTDRPIPIYGNDPTLNELGHKFSYAFFDDPDYEGGAPPRLTLNLVAPLRPFSVCGLEILPLALKHGRMDVLGYRIGDFAYCTDCSYIPDETAAQLQGLKVLILDGLRTRHHRTHFTHRQAVDEVERLRPKQTYLTHISHEIEHRQGNLDLKALTQHHVELAYDGLSIQL